MRASLLFLPPYRKHSPGSRLNATKLLVDGAYVHRIGDGLYAYLPLGMLILRNITQVIQTEFKKLGGQEMLLPVLNPLDLWVASGRDKLSADELMVLTDSKGESLVVTPTHEESMLELAREMIRDSWQLPAFFYQSQVKARDVPTGNYGIFKAREFIMEDAFSFHASFTDLNNFIPRVLNAFKRIFTQCGLQPLIAEGASSNPGSERIFDFLVLNKSGDYRIVTCESCGYVADQRVAVGIAKIGYNRPMALSRGSRSDVKHYGDVCKALGIPQSRAAVTRIFSGESGLVMMVYRADLELSVEKVSRLIGEYLVEELKDQEITDLGLVPGFLSPLGIPVKELEAKGIRVLIDNLVAETPNLVMGGNSPGMYWVNANFGRDFEGSLVGDIIKVDEKCRCYHCGGALRVRTGFKLARIKRLNDFYTKKLKVTVKNNFGESGHPFMGAYGIGLGRLMASVAQAYQDDRGLRWPMQLAPYKAVLLVVGKAGSLHRMAGEVHDLMSEHLLWDDRPVSFLDKCRDADRLGIPMRIILSSQSHEDRQAMVLSRTGTLKQRVPLSRIKAVLLDYWKQERSAVGCEDEI